MQLRLMYSAMVYCQPDRFVRLPGSSVRLFCLAWAISCLNTFIELSSHSFLRNRPTLCIPSLPPSIALREEFSSSPPPLFTARSFLFYSSLLLYHLTILHSLPIPLPITFFTPASVHPSLHLFTAHCLNRLPVQPFSRLVNVATPVHIHHFVDSPQSSNSHIIIHYESQTFADTLQLAFVPFTSVV